MENIVESLFGLSPWQVQQQQNAGMDAYASNQASKSLLQRSSENYGRAGGMFAQAGAEAMGMVNPQVEQAKQRQAMLGGLEPNAESIRQRALQISDPKLKFQLLAYANQLDEKEQAKKLAAAQLKNAIDPSAKPARKDFTAESWKVYERTGKQSDLVEAAVESKQTNDIQEYEYAKKNNGYKGTLEQWMQRKSQYESMSNEQKLVEAAADAKGLKAGTPERAKFVADAYQKLVDKRTHINVTTTGAQYNLSPEQQNALDKAVTEGRLDPARINSRSAIILANQFTLNPTLDMVSGTADAKTRTAQQAKVGVQLSVLRPFVGMVDKNGEVLKTLADKAIVTNVALANRPINWIEQNIGDHPDMAEFLAQVKIFKDEAARVVSNPNLVGVLSDTARKEMENVISGNMPLKSMRRVIERLQADSHNRISSMEDEYSKIRKQDKAPEVKSTATVSNW